MPIFLIIFLVVILLGVGYTVYKKLAEKSDRKHYLGKLAYFFEGEMQSIPDNDHSKRVAFQYEGYECSFEDIEVPGLQKGAPLNIAYLKVKAKSNLSVIFSERARTQIRSNAQSLEQVALSRWGDTRAAVELPKSLEDFHLYTNDPERAMKFINNPKVIKIIENYKNRDSRGHPLVSLQVSDGAVVLEFHAPGGLKPSILELQTNVTALEDYLQELISVAEFLQTLTGEKSS